MDAHCVRVDRERGEEARRALAEADLVAEDVEIVADDGEIYIPVVDPESVPDEYDLVVRDLPERSLPEMPADILGYDPSYERLGNVVILDEDDPERAHEIAAAVDESALPVETVLDRASKIKGEQRVRDWTVLLGESTDRKSVV